ncbi:MAG TPA: CRISPR-associated protein Cas4 [Clostridia bacterium]
MNFDFESFKTQGVKINYYFICKRKLWLYSKGITMEHLSERVEKGKLLHEKAYPRQKNREVMIDNILKIDIIDGDCIREIKLSSKMQKADRMQILYYLYYLKHLGISKTGLINYVKEKKVEVVELEEPDEREVEEALIGIKRIAEMDKPLPVEKLPYCKKCAYYEFCYASEVV